MNQFASACGRRTGLERGFGLLEAIVAVVLLASVGAALFTWLAQSVNSAVRMEAVAEDARLMDLVEQAFMQINPLRQPAGEKQLGSVRVRWEARLIEPVRHALIGDAGGVRWRVGLYQVRVRAQNQQTGHELQVDLVRTGLDDLYASPSTAVSQPE